MKSLAEDPSSDHALFNFFSELLREKKLSKTGCDPYTAILFFGTVGPYGARSTVRVYPFTDHKPRPTNLQPQRGECCETWPNSATQRPTRQEGCRSTALNYHSSKPRASDPRQPANLPTGIHQPVLTCSSGGTRKKCMF